MSLPLNAGQFDSLAKLCSNHPEFGLLACNIAERFDQAAVTDGMLATNVVTMLCRRLAEAEAEALPAIVRHLESFVVMGALSAHEASLLISKANALVSSRSDDRAGHKAS